MTSALVTARFRGFLLRYGHWIRIPHASEFVRTGLAGIDLRFFIATDAPDDSSRNSFAGFPDLLLFDSGLQLRKNREGRIDPFILAITLGLGQIHSAM